MLWCRGAQNIELSNDKLESALKCTVSSQCTPFLDVQTDKQTDEFHGSSATIPSTHNHTANGTQPNFVRGEEVNRADASRIRWRCIVNVNETIEIRYSVSRGPKNHYRASICEGGLGSRNSVRLTVCPSVRLSVCPWQTKWRTADILIPHERAIALLLWRQEWLVGNTPIPLKSAIKVTHPLRKTPTSTDFRS